ncbi:tyrosine-type recombinase/integrase [Salmonella enterica]|nr:tyrosine-type recombinase/integrase [Salmonella enterica]
MSLWDALRMNMMISYQELVRTFPNAALKRIGYGGKLVAHGLRSIASTALNEAGFNPDVIEAALAHSDKNEVRRAYNRSTYLLKRIELMNWWGELIRVSFR